MTRTEVQRLCRQIGLRPAKEAGQHFLLSEAIVQTMIHDAAVSAEDTILEIGPGLGILTEQLVGTGARVVAVELDQRLANFLRHKYRPEKKLTIIQSDIFKLDLGASGLRDREYKVVANLPYSATSLIFRNFLTLTPRPTRLTVMIQREVAQRITAAPGSMSVLSLMVQYYSHPKLLGDVPRTDFWPAPGVTSSVVDCFPIIDRDPIEARAIFRLAKAAFSSRRKQLLNSLSTLAEFTKESAASWLKECGLQPGARPQELGVEDWRKLAKKLL